MSTYYVITGNFIGSLDGKIVEMERPCDFDWQEANYNGFYRQHSRKILLLQLFDGTYGAAVVNFIGTGHDSRLAGVLNLEKLMQHLHPSFIVAGYCFYFF